jgi:hypothetical protein
MISWNAKRTCSLRKNKKFVKLKNVYALEVEKCEYLSKELNICKDLISYLRDENANLNAKIDELNVYKPSTSTVEHVTICTRCRDINFEYIYDHLAMIQEQNDHIPKLNAKNAEHELENEKKIARSMLYIGRRPGIKDFIGFQQGSQSNIKLNAPKNKLSNFVKGKAPMVQDREGYILYPENYPEHKTRRKFMLENLTMFLIMLLCIVMRLLALGIQLIPKCLKRKLSMHQMCITFHLKLLMHLMCSLTNQAK